MHRLAVLICLKAVILTNSLQPETGIMWGQGRRERRLGRIYFNVCQPSAALKVRKEMKEGNCEEWTRRGWTARCHVGLGDASNNVLHDYKVVPSEGCVITVLCRSLWGNHLVSLHRWIKKQLRVHTNSPGAGRKVCWTLAGLTLVHTGDSVESQSYTNERSAYLIPHIWLPTSSTWSRPVVRKLFLYWRTPTAQSDELKYPFITPPV